MYRCKECGAEYEEKPDYCDCGNDEFEDIALIAEVKDDVGVNNDAAQSSISDNVVNQIPEDDVQENKPKPAESQSFNHYAQSSYIPKRELHIDSLSLTIFGFCILLSLYVIFFAFNPKEQDINTEIKQEIKTSNNIPSLDKIWNNTPPAAKTEQKKTEEPIPVEVVSKVVQQIVPISKPVQQKKITTQNKPSVQQKTTPKPKTTTVTLNKIPTTKTQQKTVINAQEQAKKTAETAAKQKAEQERKAAEAAQLKKLQAEQAKKAQEEKARQDAAAKQEFINYKAQLRNTLGRKIDFTRVIGDGSCTVAFKIDSNGRLINRSFAKQSSNNTLNDAVYAAIMSTPTFNPPPAAYKNEVLNLNIKFYNGNFEISLP